MAKRLDQILVVDLEAICWSGKPPVGQESDIIEIGLARATRSEGTGWIETAYLAEAIQHRPRRQM